MNKQLQIHCDACGGSYNPNRYSVCPTCGAVVLNRVTRSKKVNISNPQEYKALKRVGLVEWRCCYDQEKRNSRGS